MGLRPQKRMKPLAEDRGERILDQALFLEAQVAAGLFEQHRHQVDSVARQIRILGGPVIGARLHEAVLRLRLQADVAHFSILQLSAIW
jgi:hypothetical protein